MTKRETLAYLAGLVDGEGYIGIKKTPAYKCQGRVSPGYHARLQVRMIDERAIAFLAETLGGWYYPEKPHANNGRPLFCYQASNAKAEHVLRSLLPFLRIKRLQAKKALSLRRLARHGRRHRTKLVGHRTFPHSSTGKPVRVRTLAFSDEYVAWCEQLYQDCKRLNGRRPLQPSQHLPAVAL